LAVLVTLGLLLRRGWLEAAAAGQVRFLALAAAVGAHTVQASISVPIVTTVYLGWFLAGLTLAASLTVRRDAAGSSMRRKARRPSNRKKRGKKGSSIDTVQVVAAVAAGVIAVVLAIPAWQIYSTSGDMGLASSAVGRDAPEVALPAARAASERSPWWPEAWHLTSRAARQDGDVELATTAAQQAVEADPLDRDGRYLLLMLAEEAGDTDAVMQQLAGLRETDPHGFQLHIDVLRFARGIGDEELAGEAATVVERAIGPEHPRWSEFESLR